MTESPSTPDDWSWFTGLPLDDRVLLLSHPTGELPDHLVERLLRRPGVAWWAWSGQPYRPMLSPSASSKLRDIQHQLNYWWDQLDPQAREHIIEHRDCGLHLEDRHLILRAASSPIAGTPSADITELIVDVGQRGNSLHLPPTVRAYVEMMSP